MTATQTTLRVHNFCAGPGALPLAVLERVRADLLNHAGSGMSVMEMSHRSTWFEEIIGGAEADVRGLLAIPVDYAVLFLQGGATLQFAMLPMNLRPADASADYILTGQWSQGALKEAEKLGRVRVAASTEATRFDRIPSAEEMRFDPQAAYLHFTSNNTIYGTQWSSEPVPPAGGPLACDASSDFLSRRIEVEKTAAISPGVQET